MPRLIIRRVGIRVKRWGLFYCSGKRCKQVASHHYKQKLYVYANAIKRKLAKRGVKVTGP